MKHLFLLTIGLFSTLILNAKVYTVSNVPNSVANFTSIWYAQDSASAGDTIYVAPSNSSYGDLHLTKPLVWIGGGTKPEGGVGAKTTVGYFVPESTCSGTEIYGFHFTGGAAPNNQSIIHNSWAVNGNVENIIISGCLFAAPIALSRTGTAYSNWVLKNNVFAVSSISCALALNWVVSNNIFVQVNPALSATNSSNTNNIFSNNIIISSNGTGLSSIKNFTIINNII